MVISICSFSRNHTNVLYQQEKKIFSNEMQQNFCEKKTLLGNETDHYDSQKHFAAAAAEICVYFNLFRCNLVALMDSSPFALPALLLLVMEF